MKIPVKTKTEFKKLWKKVYGYCLKENEVSEEFSRLEQFFKTLRRKGKSSTRTDLF